MPAAIVLLSILVAAAVAVPADPPVEQARKNIKVLQGLPESQVFLAMNFVGDSLGVHCDYCHVKTDKGWQWASDEKPPKLVALDMMRMTLLINRTNFNGGTTVTCNTCHRGSLKPERLVSLPPRDFARESKPAAPPLPAADELLARYARAVGDGEVRTLILRWNVERAESPGERELTFQAPDKILIRAGTRKQVVNGSAGWTVSGDATQQMTPADVAAVKNGVAALLPRKMTDDASAMRVVRSDGPNWIAEVSEPPVTRRYVFDRETGLLRSRLTITETKIAPLLDLVEFDDYRSVGGMKIPFIIRTSDVGAYDTATRSFTSVQINVPVDEAVFKER